MIFYNEVCQKVIELCSNNYSKERVDSIFRVEYGFSDEDIIESDKIIEKIKDKKFIEVHYMYDYYKDDSDDYIYEAMDSINDIILSGNNSYDIIAMLTALFNDVKTSTIPDDTRSLALSVIDLSIKSSFYWSSFGKRNNFSPINVAIAYSVDT